MKYVTGILVGLAVLLGGLWLVFKFVVVPKQNVIAPGTPAPAPSAPPSAAPPKEAAVISSIAALIGAAGDAYGHVVGN